MVLLSAAYSVSISTYMYMYVFGLAWRGVVLLSAAYSVSISTNVYVFCWTRRIILSVFPISVKFLQENNGDFFIHVCLWPNPSLFY